APAIRVDRPGKRHFAPAVATVQQRAHRQCEIFNFMSLTHALSVRGQACDPNEARAGFREQGQGRHICRFAVCSLYYHRTVVTIPAQIIIFVARSPGEPAMHLATAVFNYSILTIVIPAAEFCPSQPPTRYHSAFRGWARGGTMKKLKLVVSLPNENSYQLEQARAARETAAELGVDVQILFADNDAVTQSQQVLEIVQSPSARPDAMLFEPLSATALSRVG